MLLNRCNFKVNFLVNYEIQLGITILFGLEINVLFLLSGVPPIVPELNGDDDTSYFDDIEQDDPSPTETFPTPTVSIV